MNFLDFESILQGGYLFKDAFIFCHQSRSIGNAILQDGFKLRFW